MAWISSIGGMEQVRSTWTDSRLDDLNGRVGELSTRVGELDVRLTGRIDGLQQTILHVGGALLASVIGLMAAIIGLIATQI
jgi:hypothetical protein